MSQPAKTAKRECAAAKAYLRHQGTSAQIVFAGSPSNLDWEDAGP
jgi:hypothetical protein